MPQHPFDHGALILRDENLAAWPRTEEVVRDQFAEYYGLISHLDEQVGRMLAALDENGQAENTIVVYAADHGLAVGSHGLLGKQNLYEHSMRCPPAPLRRDLTGTERKPDRWQPEWIVEKYFDVPAVGDG